MQKRGRAMRIKKAVALMLVLVSITSLCSCKSSKAAFSSQNIVMDTTLSQKIYGESDVSGKVFAALSEWESRFSAFKEGSDIHKINNANGKAVSVSEQTFELVKKGAEYSKQSEGIFDISVYPLSRLWKDAIRDKKLADEKDILSAKSQVNFEKILLDSKENSVQIPKGMGLDLGAIAKGAALNAVREIYEQSGASGAICSLGSSAMLLYKNKGGEDFRIGLKNPFEANEGELFATLSLSDCVISTSGGYERCAEIYGKRYHHIIDTKTGYPAESDIASVTVVGQDGAFCDYMSTRLFLEGSQRAVEIVEQQDICAVIVTENKKVYVSKNLQDKIKITDSSFERIKSK